MKERLVSKDNAIIVFAAIIFIVHVWSIYNLLREIPAWILRLSSWDLAGVISYTLMFALVESIIVLVFLLVLAALLPGKIFRDKFVSISTVFIFLAAVWVVSFRYLEDRIRSWGMTGMLLLLALALATFVIAYLVVLKSEKADHMLNSLMQRVTLLSYLYLFIDITALVIVVSRNV